MKLFVKLTCVVAAVLSHATIGVVAQASTLGPCADLKQLAELDKSTVMEPAIVSRVIEMPQPIYLAFWKQIWLWPTWDAAYVQVNNTRPLQTCDVPLTRSETDLPWPGPFMAPSNMTEIVIGIDEDPGMYRISLSTDVPTIRFTRLDASFEAIPDLTSTASESGDGDGDDHTAADVADVLKSGHTLVWTRERAMGKAVDYSPGHFNYDFTWMAEKFFRGSECLAAAYRYQKDAAKNGIVKALDPKIVKMLCQDLSAPDNSAMTQRLRPRR